MAANLDDRLDAIYEAVMDYEAARVADLVRKEVDAGTDIGLVLDDALITAMDEVGDLFGRGDLFVPELLMAAKAMQAGLEVLRPLLAASHIEPLGRIVIGTVRGDLHEIGKNLVGMMLEGAGFEVIDLGVDAHPEAFVAAAGEKNADIVGMSALLTTTMSNMGKTIIALREAGLNMPVMVGGAPVTKDFARDIGADGHAVDAPGAVQVARSFMAAVEE